MRPLFIVPLLLWAAAGCSSSQTPVADEILALDIDAVSFVDVVDHRYLPLLPGALRGYAPPAPEARVHTSAEVSLTRRTINGVEATETRTVSTVDGVRATETWRWYAQDTDGNVWRLGETHCRFLNGACASMEGTWTWGTDDARPGIAMLAAPELRGQRYAGAFRAGVVEDTGEVVERVDSVNVGAGAFNDCVRIHETSPLSAGRNLLYCADVGLVRMREAGLLQELVEQSDPPPLQ